MNTKQKIILFGSATLLTAALAFGSVVWGGAVTVAGTDPHYAPVQWVLETTMESSVRQHAADVEIPAGVDLLDPALAERAFGHYSVACTPCHGAPGVDAAPWLVLNPPAELLVETADGWSDQEIYWIVKNGIKMTGMPALGPTHGEDDLWAISAMVRQLPTMTPAEYQAMADRFAARQQGGDAPDSASMAATTLDDAMEGVEDPAGLERGQPAEVDVVAPQGPVPVAEPEPAPRRVRAKRPRRPSTGASPETAAPVAPTSPPPAAPSQHEHHGHHPHHHQG